VRHEHPQGDRLFALLIDGLEVGNVLRHRRIEVELPVFDELHDRDVGEQLRHRPDAVDGLGGRRNRPRAVLESEPGRPHHLLVVHERDREGRELLVRDLLRDEPLHSAAAALYGSTGGTDGCACANVPSAQATMRAAE
jgi:hypothetical protein